MAFQIIRHALRMIFGNLGQALRCSIGPYVILILGYILAFTIFGGSMRMMGPGQMGTPEMMGDGGAGLVLLVFLLIPFTLFVISWVAVSWHRFILLEEYSGILPAVSDRPIWPYAGRSLLYGLLVGLAAIPVFIVASLIAAPMAGPGMGGGVSPLALIIFVLVTAILTYLWFRIAIALPAVAVGKPITMGQAWEASKGMSGTIFGVAFLLMAINGIATILTTQIAMILGPLAFLIDLAVQWTILMLGVSILTTFYGHLIEKRPLID